MFDIEMEQKVKLHLSGERGVVVGRAENLNFPNQYRVEYVAGDGRQVSDWFFKDQLVLVNE